METFSYRLTQVHLENGRLKGERERTAIGNNVITADRATAPSPVNRTSPETAVQLQPKTDRSRVVAVRNEANLARDDRRIYLTQLGNVRVAVALKDLQHGAT